MQLGKERPRLISTLDVFKCVEAVYYRDDVFV